jgi:hypothetical protein
VAGARGKAYPYKSMKGSLSFLEVSLIELGLLGVERLI